MTKITIHTFSIMFLIWILPEKNMYSYGFDNDVLYSYLWRMRNIYAAVYIIYYTRRIMHIYIYIYNTQRNRLSSIHEDLHFVRACVNIYAPFVIFSPYFERDRDFPLSSRPKRPRRGPSTRNPFDKRRELLFSSLLLFGFPRPHSTHESARLVCRGARARRAWTLQLAASRGLEVYITLPSPRKNYLVFLDKFEIWNSLKKSGHATDHENKVDFLHWAIRTRVFLYTAAHSTPI